MTGSIELQIFFFLFSEMMGLEAKKTPRVNVYQCLLDCMPQVGLDTVKHYATRQLSILLSLNPVLKGQQHFVCLQQHCHISKHNVLIFEDS